MADPNEWPPRRVNGTYYPASYTHSPRYPIPAQPSASHTHYPSNYTSAQPSASHTHYPSIFSPPQPSAWRTHYPNNSTPTQPSAFHTHCTSTAHPAQSSASHTHYTSNLNPTQPSAFHTHYPSGYTSAQPSASHTQYPSFFPPAQPSPWHTHYSSNFSPTQPPASIPRAPSRAPRDETFNRRPNNASLNHIFHRTDRSPLRRSQLRHYLGSTLYVPYVSPIDSDRISNYIEQQAHLHSHSPGTPCAIAFLCESSIHRTPEGVDVELFVPARDISGLEDWDPVPDRHRYPMDYELALRPEYRAWWMRENFGLKMEQEWAGDGMEQEGADDEMEQEWADDEMEQERTSYEMEQERTSYGMEQEWHRMLYEENARVARLQEEYEMRLAQAVLDSELLRRRERWYNPERVLNSSTPPGRRRFDSGVAVSSLPPPPPARRPEDGVLDSPNPPEGRPGDRVWYLPPGFTFIGDPDASHEGDLEADEAARAPEPAIVVSDTQRWRIIEARKYD